MKKINLQDIATVVETKTDAYGNLSIKDKKEVRAAFFPGEVTAYQGYQQIGTYNAHIYLDETNPYIIERAFRLEGYYIFVNLYGNDNDLEWYKIDYVQPGVTKITDNVVNDVHAYLVKATPIEEESVPSEASISSVSSSSSSESSEGDTNNSGEVYP